MNTKNFKDAVAKETQDVDFSSKSYQIHFQTNKGAITLDLYPNVAPGHCLNIIGLAKAGFYDGIIFHRIVPGFVIQAGCPQGSGVGGPGYTIKAEFNDTPHKPGTLSMARTNDPHSAGSQFFLCLEEVPYLDGQYTVFGQATDDASVQVIKSIGGVKTGAGDKPLEPVVIEKASVLVR